MNTKTLTAREVYQVLLKAASGAATMRRLSGESWAEIYCGLVTMEVDGWVITLYNDCEALDYCDSCYSPDGRAYDYSSPLNQGADPVELLNAHEHKMLEARLNAV